MNGIDEVNAYDAVDRARCKVHFMTHALGLGGTELFDSRELDGVALILKGIEEDIREAAELLAAALGEDAEA